MGQAYRELTQYYPQPGWVEHNPREIWDATHWAMGAALAQAGLAPTDIAALGLTVQRETCLLWNRLTGLPLANAIIENCNGGVKPVRVIATLKDTPAYPVYP